jgi:hypothetical protein
MGGKITVEQGFDQNQENSKLFSTICQVRELFQLQI